MPIGISDSEKVTQCLAKLAPETSKRENPKASSNSSDVKDLKKEQPSQYDSQPKPQPSDAVAKLTSLFWQNPLNADTVSRCMDPDLDEFVAVAPQPPVQTYYFSVPNSQGEDKVVFKIPKQILENYPKPSLQELLSIVGQLNNFIKIPIRTFVWDNAFSAEYDPKTHQVHLDVNSFFEIPRTERNKMELVHEMGHGIYEKGSKKNEKGFKENKNWELVFDLSLTGRNYEIIDDSNYYIGLPDMVGHPFQRRNEAFASSVHAYFLKGDRFADYIKSPKTPQAMQEFGKLVWVFLREEVFQGKVFTSDRNDPFANESLQALLKRGEGKRLKSLIAALKDPDSYVQESVARSLGKIGEKAWNPLLAALQDHEPLVRAHAAKALGKMGPRAVKILIKLLKNKNEEFLVRQAAAEALADVGDAAVQVLMVELKNSHAEVRALAALALGNLGPVAKDAIPALIEALRDPETMVVENAGEALSKMGPAAVAPLIAVIREKKWPLAMIAAAYALGIIGQPAVEPLLPLLSDPSPAIQELSAMALGEMYEQAAAAVPALTARIKDEKDPDLLIQFIKTLGCICSKAKSAIPVLFSILLKAVKNKEVKVVEALSAAFIQIGGVGPEEKYFVPTLIEALKHPEQQVRWVAAISLGSPVARDAVPALIAALKDKDSLVRVFAIGSLGKIAEKDGDISDAIPILRRLAKEDANEVVRNKALSVLDALPWSLRNAEEGSKKRWASKIAAGLNFEKKSDLFFRGSTGISFPWGEQFHLETALHYTRFHGSHRTGISVGGDYLFPSLPLSLGLGLSPQYDFGTKTFDVGLTGEASYRNPFWDQNLSLGMFLETPGLFRKEDRGLALGIQVGWQLP